MKTIMILAGAIVGGLVVLSNGVDGLRYMIIFSLGVVFRVVIFEYKEVFSYQKSQKKQESSFEGTPPETFQNLNYIPHSDKPTRDQGQ